MGDCKFVHTFNFEDENRSKYWYKGPQIAISFEQDEFLTSQVKKSKSLGIKNSKINSELFGKITHEDYAAELIKMNGTNYLVLYFSNEGKLKLYPICDENATEK